MSDENLNAESDVDGGAESASAKLGEGGDATNTDVPDTGDGGDGGDGGGGDKSDDLGAANSSAAPDDSPDGSTEPQVQSWLNDLPEDLRADEHVQRYKTAADAAKALIEGRKALSNAIQLPGKDASEADKAKFFNQIGRPESADGYELPEIEGYEFTDVDRASLKGMQEFAHGIGLSKTQFSQMLGWQTQTALSNAKASQDARAKATAEGFKALDEDWGPAKDENYAIASKAKALIGLTDKELDALGDALSTEPGKGHALIVKALHRIGSRAMEGDLGGELDRDVPGELAGKSIGELKDMHAAMMREPDYWNNNTTQAKTRRIFQRIVQLENREHKAA